MRTIKGPAVFLAQFASDEAPFNSIEGLAGWASAKGFKGVQIPTWDKRVIDLKQAAESQTYCDDYAGKLAEHGLARLDQRQRCGTHARGLGHARQRGPALQRIARRSDHQRGKHQLQ